MSIPTEVIASSRLASAAWSLLAEPGDETAGALRTALGTTVALDWAHRALTASDDGVPTVLLAELATSAGTLDAATAQRVRRGVERWRRRAPGADPRPLLDRLERLDGRLVTPGEALWPSGLDDLAAAAPACLWVRGRLDVPRLDQRSVALVGSRAATPYGSLLAGELGAGLADDGFAVVSGGAFGIDVAAHRGVLAAGGHTVVLLAGGVDRPYPAGHARVFEAVRNEGGAVVSEVPLGWSPTRSRFLLRNRLIAALARGTVVVEAALRSGALSTARHAAALLRPVGAVPGPVTSMSSAGCHGLIRDAVATCVTSVAEVAELVGALGRDALEPAQGELGASEALDETARRVLDAVPVRQGATSGSVLRTAGVGDHEGRAALGLLELGGHVRRTGDTWVRAGSVKRSP